MNVNDAISKQRLEEHRMYTASDLAYLRGKGCDDNEIRAFWDRDEAAGFEPLEHRPIPDLLSVLSGAGLRRDPVSGRWWQRKPRRTQR
jgi:hypothetical protein